MNRAELMLLNQQANQMKKDHYRLIQLKLLT
eukprot:CAMPEP_0176453212 /NCGR_PEP_ID=MMETSP0127-20121128/29084_1 /TAXON_ID=938130 /ORGANISM="Platyophrya macrostoma, Strain WH" /LENGTH=30 /DNA_ID= /DNA_START= /DNA_END= /DNA_ORIENTATION=